MIRVKFIKDEVTTGLIRSKKREAKLRMKIIDVEKVDTELILEDSFNEDKEQKKIPYIIASNKIYQLWRFFRSLKNGIMELDKEPRHMIQKGTQWFKIDSFEVI